MSTACESFLVCLCLQDACCEVLRRSKAKLNLAQASQTLELRSAVPVEVLSKESSLPRWTYPQFMLCLQLHTDLFTACVEGCHGTCVEVGGQLAGAGSLLPSCGSLGLLTSALAASLLPAESHLASPMVCFYLVCARVHTHLRLHVCVGGGGGMPNAYRALSTIYIFFLIFN